MVESFKKVTCEAANEFFAKMRSSPSRLNVKFMSKNHEGNTEEIENAKEENKKIYE